MNIKITRLSRISETVRRGVAPDYADGGHTKIINQACVQQSGIVLEKAKYQSDAVLLPEKARILEYDILINSTGAGTLGRVGFVGFATENIFADGHVSILRISDPEVIQKYVFYHLFNMQDYFENVLAKGATNQTELSPKSIGDVEIPIPSLPEQQSIVAFLDAKLAQIDKFIANKRRLIELLLEQKQVIVNRYVTRGLNDSVELKDSGLDWLGQVPKHWEIEQAGRSLKQKSLAVRPDDKVVTVFRDGQVTLRENRRTTGFMEALLEIGYQGVEPGDLVLHSMDAFAGAIGVSDSRGKCTPEYIVCDHDLEKVEPEYFALILRKMALDGYILILCPSVRERAPRFRYSNFKSVRLPFPPLFEQRAIVARIEHETSAIARAAAQAEREIELIQEYRTTLISDAVTGKIDVRAWGKVNGEIVN